jgi:hypothetical protein
MEVFVNRGVCLCGVALTAVIGAVAAPAEAVRPRAITFLFHDHGTAGDGWHIELVVARDQGSLKQVVMHSERCDETVLTSNVKIGAGGRATSSKPFTTFDGGQGAWRLDARWIAPNVVSGTFHVTEPGCDGGPRTFMAHGAGGAHGKHTHTGSGTAIGDYPDLERANGRAVAQVDRLWRSSVQAARERFSTYRRAREVGFAPWKRDWKPPLLFHVRHAGYERDGRSLDPRRPESLVYWWPRTGPPVLVAFMYRAPLKPRTPAFGRPLLGWHAHGAKPGATLMTHVWMTGDLRSAIANCMPVGALEAASAEFKLVPTSHDLTAESVPCHHTAS